MLYKKDNTPRLSRIIPRMHIWFNIQKPMNIIHHMDKNKGKNYDHLNKWKKGICQYSIPLRD